MVVSIHFWLVDFFKVIIVIFYLKENLVWVDYKASDPGAAQLLNACLCILNQSAGVYIDLCKKI